MNTAIILLNVKRKLVNDVAEQLAGMQEISEVYSVTGQYDLICIVRVRDNDVLANLMTDKISTVKGITQTNTMLAFKAFSKHDLDSMFAI
jgi:DNA-binding Lrp family transcriptional regulator